MELSKTSSPHLTVFVHITYTLLSYSDEKEIRKGIFMSQNESVFSAYTTHASQPQTKCGLFGQDPSPWDQVVFDNDPGITAGTNIKLAFQQAKTIFDAGKVNRNAATQVLVLMSDADYTPEESPVVDAETLKGMGVEVFTVGVGSWLRVGSLQILSSNTLYYDSYAAWLEMVNTYPSSFDEGEKL